MSPVFAAPKIGIVRGVRVGMADGPTNLWIKNGFVHSIGEQGAFGGPILWDGGGSVHPGLVDVHNHLTGGGGSAGPISRPPSIRAGDLLAAGVTTVAGCIGRDASRSAGPTMLGAVRGLRQHGIDAVMFSGGLGPRPATILGDTADDAALVDGVVGVKFAIDQDAPQRTVSELVTELRTVVAVARDYARRPLFTVHVGPEKAHADAAVEFVGELPPELMPSVLITHVNWNDAHLDRFKRIATTGVWLDVTAVLTGRDFTGAVSPSDALVRLTEAGCENLTVSSDSNGSHVTIAPDGEPTIHRHLVSQYSAQYVEVGRVLGTDAADYHFSVAPRQFLSGRPAVISERDESTAMGAADLVVRDESLNPMFVLTSGGAVWRRDG